MSDFLARDSRDNSDESDDSESFDESEGSEDTDYEDVQTLAHRINQLSSVPYPMRHTEIIPQTVGSSAARFRAMHVEKTLDNVTGPVLKYKWTQNVRYNLFVQTGIIPQRVEVLLVTNRKPFFTFIAALNAAEEHLANMSRTFLYNSKIRSSCEVLQTYSFVLEPFGAKGISGDWTSPLRSTEDYEEASNISDLHWQPTGSLFLVLRHCNVTSPTMHSSLSGQYNHTSLTYANRRG